MEDKFGASIIRELLMKAAWICNKLVITGRRRQVYHGDGSVLGGDGHGSECFVWVLGKLRKTASPWWSCMK